MQSWMPSTIHPFRIGCTFKNRSSMVSWGIFPSSSTFVLLLNSLTPRTSSLTSLSRSIALEAPRTAPRPLAYSSRIFYKIHNIHTESNDLFLFFSFFFFFFLEWYTLWGGYSVQFPKAPAREYMISSHSSCRPYFKQAIVSLKSCNVIPKWSNVLSFSK